MLAGRKNKNWQLIQKILIFALPLYIMIVNGFISGTVFLFHPAKRLMPALAQIDYRLVGHFFLCGLVFLMLFLCGARVYGFLVRLFRFPERKPGRETLLLYFLLGSLFLYLLFLITGGLGLFHSLLLWIVILAFLVQPWGFKEFSGHLRVMLRAFRPRKDTGNLLCYAAFLYMALPLLLLQFTSPFPPRVDIMEVYVAPVQRVLNFGRYLPADALPFAFYNASRSVPLHTGLYSFVGALTGLPAYTAITGCYFYILILSVLAVSALARVMGGPLAAGASAWLFAFSYNFMHIIDGRSSALTFIYIMLFFLYLFKVLLNKDPSGNFRMSLFAGLALGAAILCHPVAGFFALLGAGLSYLAFQSWMGFRTFKNTFSMFPVALLSSSPLVFNFRGLVHWSLLQAGFMWLGLVLLAGGILFLLHRRPAVSQNVQFPGDRKIWIPFCIAIITVHVVCLVSWNFFMRKDLPLVLAFKFEPVFMLLALAAFLRLNYLFLTESDLVRRRKQGLLILTGSLCLMAYALPLYIAPLLPLTGLSAQSFSFEMPFKGLFFMLIPFFSAYIACLFLRNSPRVNRILIFLLFCFAILPVGDFFKAKRPNFFDRLQQSYIQTVNEQLDMAQMGYFGAWDLNPRMPLGSENLQFTAHLEELIRSREITIHDTIVHVASEQHPWIALPFPAFTGIRQSLLLVKRSQGDIHTAFGRIEDFPQDFDLQDPPRWVLLENDVSVPGNIRWLLNLNYTKDYSNRRITLYRWDS